MDKNSVFLINRIVQKDVNISSERKCMLHDNYHLMSCFVAENTFTRTE